MKNEKKKIDVLTALSYIPLIIKLVTKYWSSIAQAWVLLKPLINDIIEEVKKAEQKKKNGRE